MVVGVEHLTVIINSILFISIHSLSVSFLIFYIMYKKDMKYDGLQLQKMEIEETV